MRNQATAFMRNLKEVGYVEMGFKIDMGPTFRHLPRDVVLKHVQSFVGNGYVSQLIFSLLTIQLVNEEGKPMPEICFWCMRPVGEMTSVLLSLVLVETLDQHIAKKKVTGSIFL